jgi:hypothetical protein
VDYTQWLNAMKQIPTTENPPYEKIPEGSEHEARGETWSTDHATYGDTRKKTQDGAL